MTTNYSAAVNTAREYYNSEDADNFYFHVWGGEDIHIGWYQCDDEPIPTASQRTVAHMADKLEGHLRASSKVLDLGAGYGGAARYLAKRFGCSVVALNLSEAENERNRQFNQEQDLQDKIDVVDASFEEIPHPENSFDVIWSQDAFLHSGQRKRVIEEAARVLKPGGCLIFTDPMQADDCPNGVLQPILDRIHLETLGSPKFYREACGSLGMQELEFEEATHQLIRHYSRVLQETQQRGPELVGLVSLEYLERMKKGLQHWIHGGEQGYLAWGIFRFQMPS